MSQNAFESAYAKLNPRQKEAVDTLEGPVMVVAGPGTGKTQILTLRIAQIVQKTDTPADGILALTFTDAGVRAMRERLHALMGAPAYRVKIATFHGFAQEIIARYPESFPQIVGSRPALEYDILQILEQLLDTGSYAIIRPFGAPYYYLRDIKSALSSLKREAVTPELYRKQVEGYQASIESAPDLYHEKGAHKGKMKGDYAKELERCQRALEFADLFARYEMALTEAQRFDFDDSILAVVEALSSNETLRLVVQEQYLYVLADEHQDSNGAQNKLLALLVNFHENPNLFVVGDDKQAIFRFQGASLDHFYSFSKQFPEAKLIHLEENYRSTQTILDGAHTILKTDLSARAGHTERPLELWSAPDSASELLAVAEAIKAIPEGETTAVMFRRNADALPLMELFDRVGIRYAVRSPQEIVGDADIMRLLVLFRAVANYPSEEYTARALLLDFAGHDELFVYEAIRASQEGRKKLLEHLKDSPFVAKLRAWARSANNDPLPEVSARIIRESGYLSALLAKPSASRALLKLHALWDEIHSFAEGKHDARLIDFMNYLDAVAVHGVKLERELSDVEARVTLLTVHKSKGLEFDHVFIVGATESAWDGAGRRGPFDIRPKQKEEDGEVLSDIRRLFYVALTRAKHRAVMTYAKKDLRGRDVLPAEIISEIDEHLISKRELPMAEVSVKADAVFGASKADHRLRSEERVKSWFDTQGLSATALNNYLECPWRYFYRSLVRIPQAEDKHLLYGTAVHAGLKRMFDPITEGNPPSLSDALVEFERIVGRQPYKASDREEILEKGRRALRAYAAEHQKDYPSAVLTEYPVRGVFLGDIPLVGKLDRIDIVGDGTVRVVDYKTGKPKSKAEIEKKGLRRQMIFYKVLLSLFENGKYRMTEGILDFVEPDDKGKLKREIVAVADEEVQALEKEIVRIADEIRTLAFWDKRCEDAECEYCELRDEVEAQKLF